MTTKPTVHYTEAGLYAQTCWLKPIDHPNHLDGHDVSNGMPVRTSAVLSCDHTTGRIETKNTIYMPAPGAQLNGISYGAQHGT